MYSLLGAGPHAVSNTSTSLICSQDTGTSLERRFLFAKKATVQKRRESLKKAGKFHESRESHFQKYNFLYTRSTASPDIMKSIQVTEKVQGSG